MRIAVAGGTGLIGRMAIEELQARGHQPVSISRSSGVDLTTGTGLSEFLTGVGAVIDVTDIKALRKRRERSLKFFGTATRHLLEAEKENGVTHHVTLSIVGVDAVDYPYYAGKRLQEQLALDGPIAGSVLRATQFHEFVGQLLDAQGRIALVPRWPVQPIAAREIAARLVDIAAGEPVGYAPELAGPQVENLVGLARTLAAEQERRRHLIAAGIPGPVGRAMGRGANLPTGEADLGVTTFEEWLTGPDAAPWR